MFTKSMLTELLLRNRGYSDEFMSDLDSYVPNETFLDVERMCERLKAIHDAGREITFIPDFDMDGIMSGTVGFAGLAELGFRVNLFVPNPGEGYGFGRDTIARLVREYPNTSAIMSGDVGITCFDGVRAAREMGLEFLLTDHHVPDRVRSMSGELGDDRLPDATVVVDPMRTDDPFSDPHICGASVVQQVLQTYANMYCGRQEQERIRRLRVFAGLGAISDSMPLRHANRHLVRDAVSIARLVYNNRSTYVVDNLDGSPMYKCAFRGLYSVLLCLREAKKFESVEDIDEMLFGFYVSPMFNAAKRMNANMTRVFGVFFGANPDEDVKYMYDLNESRKAAVQDYLARLREREQPYAPYIYLSDAPEGILGLLATRMMDRSVGPCLVVREKEGGGFKGSGRSPEWYPFLTRTLGTRCVFASGHEGAFGVGMRDERDLIDTFELLRADAESQRGSVDMSVYRPKADFVIADDGSGDTIIDVVSFMEFMSDMDELRPFGVGFPEPSVMLRFRPGDGEWRTMGSMNQHLKISLPHGFDVICWNQGDRLSLARTSDELRVWGKLSVNRYKDSVTVQFTGAME